jgi:XTP/dITP diphosphohydrolase
MELWIATTNKDKYKEIKELLKDLPVDVHAALELPNYTAPRETGVTFAENAKIKARFLKAMKSDAWVLSDDSGLEVTALKGIPGVHSARYAGPNARDIENNLKLIKQIQIQTSGADRSGQFRCVMCLLGPNGEEELFEGLLKGTIAKDIRGKYGFGYDPLFIPEGDTKTLAELGMAVKNKLSHRAQALRSVKKYLESRLKPSSETHQEL